MDAELIAIVRRHLRFVLPGESIDPDALLRDLGLDSMSAINLLVDIEQTLNLVFPDDLLTQATFETARSLATAIGRIREAGAA